MIKRSKKTHFMRIIALRRPEGAVKGLNIETIKRFSVWCVVGNE